MPYTNDEAASIFVRFYKKKNLKVQKAPLLYFCFLGRFSHKLFYFSRIVEAINNYPEKFQAELTWKELGDQFDNRRIRG